MSNRRNRKIISVVKKNWFSECTYNIREYNFFNYILLYANYVFDHTLWKSYSGAGDVIFEKT